MVQNEHNQAIQISAIVKYLNMRRNESIWIIKANRQNYQAKK